VFQSVNNQSIEKNSLAKKPFNTAIGKALLLHLSDFKDSYLSGKTYFFCQ
jgi:hypothetical protein